MTNTASPDDQANAELKKKIRQIIKLYKSENILRPALKKRNHILINFEDAILNITTEAYKRGYTTGVIDNSLNKDKLIAQEANKAQLQLLRELKDGLPKKQNRKSDEEYGYCITCNQIIDSREADCFCSIHNLATDQVTAQIDNLMKGLSG